MEPLQHNAAGGLLFARLSEWTERVQDWCAGRSWLVRAPLLLGLVYVAVRHIADPLYTSLFGALNLALHEAGHLLFGYLPGGVDICEEEATLIREAAAAFLAGESLAAICRRWNDAGVATPQAGKQWAGSVLRKLSPLLRTRSLSPFIHCSKMAPPM